MSIKSKIQALITAANTKTGESDTTLTDAVQTLVDGYGQGGGGGEVLLGSGTYTTVTDASSMTIPISVTGTPVCCFVKVDTVSSAGIQTAAWYAYNQQHSEATNLFRIVGTARGATANGFTNAILLPQNTTTLNNNQIVVYQVNNNYPIRASTYRWYVWGYAS